MERTRSSGAADCARKRKRGALQDISNNAKKLSQSRPSSRRSSGVVKKEKKETGNDASSKASRASVRRKTTATTVNSALKSSMASTAASKAKKRAPAGKKTETTRTKKRKLEGAENQPPAPHQKIQTSMLSFQAPSKPKENQEYAEADKENVNVKTEIYAGDNQVETVTVKQELDINEKMRTILVDWLVEVGEEYELDSQTFHKAFEEVYGPNVEEFVYISDQTYTADEYLSDFALLFYHMVRFKPSVLVASAVYLARLTTGEAEPWTPTLHHVTKYNPLEFQDCVEELHRLHTIESQVVNTQRDKAKAVSEKYLADKFHQASTVPACSKNQLADSFDQYAPA
ncbi:hypothetical protein PInf_022976 [Phytophthora infestans]|nr:hypothetical protein PInf_022976 [Phytophthora infestans]